MLATLVEEPPSEGEWWCEHKYDGIRALCEIKDGKATIWSRNRLDLTAHFGEIARALQRLPDAVVDGEAVALDRDGVSRFEALHQGGESRLFAFDLLWLQGQDLCALPIEERRDRLERLFAQVELPLALAERLDVGVREALAQVAKQGGEGVVCKRKGSLYESGRSKEWLKLKVLDSAELAIVGYTPATNSDELIGALLLGVAEGEYFRFAGKVGTGFSLAQRRELKQRLDLDVAAPPRGAPRLKRAVWVAPRLVAQVRFAEWTRDGKLRHPSFQGLRIDKQPSETAREMHENVTLTKPDKVLFPDSGYTKKDVADYYQALSGPLIAALDDRPIAFEQWPNGIGEHGIFRQHVPNPQPWMHLVDTPTSTARGSARHLVPDSPDGLRWLAQNAALAIHMWSAREGRLDQPDWLIFDLDPADGEGFTQIVPIAHELKRLLDELSLPSLPKTTGKRGLHVLVPLEDGHTHERAHEFAVAIGEKIVARLPQATMARAKKERHGRAYFDVHQNGYGKTIIAPYSLRGSAGAPVSTPLDWSEVTEKLVPSSFNLRNLPARVDRLGDLFAFTRRVRLP
jgi:bifunctional non-homologous end joining protein LigD